MRYRAALHPEGASARERRAPGIYAAGKDRASEQRVAEGATTTDCELSQRVPVPQAATVAAVRTLPRRPPAALLPRPELLDAPVELEQLLLERLKQLRRLGLG